MRITRWDQETDSEFTDEVCAEIALACTARISADEVRETLAAAIRGRNYRALIDFELDYSGISIWDAINIRQALALFTKRSDLRLDGVDPKRTAVEKFIEAEQSCSMTNDMLQKARTGEFTLFPRMGARLYRTSQKIALILGVCPKLSDLGFRFGPGATSQVQRRKASARRKLGQVYACSEDLAGVVKDVLAECPSLVGSGTRESSYPSVSATVAVGNNGSEMVLSMREEPSDLLDLDLIFHETLVERAEELGEWLRKKQKEFETRAIADLPAGFQARCESICLEWTDRVPVEIHPGRLSFVPKTAKTHRAIVVEPTLNGFVQLGIGDYIAQRLNRHGVDIKDQTRNQRLAREGSLSGALATLDLSSASDTISYELVKDLLPFEWFELLSCARTSKVVCEGVTLRMQKFSSMGNGFTFPLETLIFYAMAQAVAEELGLSSTDISVYGDDIIVPTTMFGELCDTLRCFGFTPNAAKSFANGPFRESCGADYLSGVNIRPFYVKGPLAGFDLFRLHNQFFRAGDSELAEIVLRYIDPSVRKFGPDGYGDGHLLGDFDRISHKREKGYQGYIFETYTFKSRWDFEVLPGDRVLPCYSIYTKEQAPLEAWNRVRYLGRYRRYSGEYLVESLSKHCGDFREGVNAVKYDSKARMGVSIPGVRGCKLIKVYVLS